jgi:riboflavin biosynthesis pyrimidine reductase
MTLASRIFLLLASVCISACDVLAFVPRTPSLNLLDATLIGAAHSTKTLPVRLCAGKVALSTARNPIVKGAKGGLFASSDEQSSAIPEKAKQQTVTGVTLKLAFDSSPSCWGIADLSATKSERFTSPQSLDMVHRLRAVSDCVLVGKGTVVADDCTLTVRRGYETSMLAELGRDQPARVVLDSNLELIRHHVDESCDACYKMLEDGLPVIIYHLGTFDIGEDVEAFLRDMPAITLVDASKLQSENVEATIIQGGSLQIFSVPTDQGKVTISPQLVVQDLQSRGIHHIMVEGGAATALSFLRAGVVDRAVIVKASVQFQEPLDSNINAEVLERVGGLKMLGTSDEKGDMFGGDCLQYWLARDAREVDWPTAVLTDWP